MKNPIIVKMALVLSGLIATGVGVGILFVPHAFHASSGLALGNDVNLLNEVRSQGGIVLVAGLFMLFGAFRVTMTWTALILSATLYLSYGLSRLVSVGFDGVPNAAMLQITALELFIGAFCAVLIRVSWAQNRVDASPRHL
jgi:hypothetical protein